jgi:plastocyanin
MTRRQWLALAGVGLVPGLAAAEPADVKVTIDNFTFKPDKITVPRGTKVTWVNQDDIPHTVVDAKDAHRMKSPAMDTDESFSFTFTTPGTYGYFCSLHPHMQGTVIVR